MRWHSAAIRLVIPDNTAQTALTTLRSLGLSLTTLERADVWQFDCAGALAPDAFLARVEHIEAIYNLNKHRIQALLGPGPEAGEVWIRDIDEAIPADAADILRQFGGDAIKVRHRTAWRLLQNAVPVHSDVLHRAADTLLCNPAYQEASFPEIANPAK